MTEATNGKAPANGEELTYEQLAELEKQFNDVEMQIIIQQTALNAPLYEKRKALIAKIPNFWGLVLEASPVDIEQFIQPGDHPVLVGSLTDVAIDRFEIPPPASKTGGSPRSFSISMSFSDNDHFSATTLTKKFWFRHAKGGSWAGLVSEPVRIPWKKGKDLTEGLLDAACNAFGSEKAAHSKENGSAAKNGLKKRSMTAEQKILAGKMDQLAQGSVSFFAWFGFRGKHISEEESRTAEEAEQEKRKKIRAGEKVPEDDVDADAEHEDDDEEDEDELEIFPDGDELAISISEELHPNALKYYMQAEMDEISDMDSEDAAMLDDDSDSSADDTNIRKLVQHVKKRETNDGDRPKKKQKPN